MFRTLIYIIGYYPVFIHKILPLHSSFSLYKKSENVLVFHTAFFLRFISHLKCPIHLKKPVSHLATQKSCSLWNTNIHHRAHSSPQLIMMYLLILPLS